MSNPRASIQRAVAPPPGAVVVSEQRPVGTIDAAERPARPIGKQHGRMRSVNLSLPSEAADALRQETVRRGSTLGEVLMDLVRAANVPTAARAEGRGPVVRRETSTKNTYVLLTPQEATELSARASRSNRTVSDLAGLAVQAGLELALRQPLRRAFPMDAGCDGARQRRVDPSSEVPAARSGDRLDL